MPMTHLATTPTLDEALLRQALALPPEQKLRLVQEVVQSELGANAEEQHQFIETLDATLTELRTAEASKPAPNGKPRWQEQEDRAMLSMAWIRQHRKEYGGQWVVLDGDRLIAAGNDILALKAAMEAADNYSLFDFVEPADAPLYSLVLTRAGAIAG